MSYCINPKCLQRQNPDDLDNCKACSTPLLIRDNYRLIQPLRSLERSRYVEVFEIEDHLHHRKVLKILKTSHEELIQFFVKEAKVLSWLTHPGIPKVEPEPDGYFQLSLLNNIDLHCLVMEKIEGETLSQWLMQNKLFSPDLALRWLKDLIQILGQVHQNNLFHRDIKPSNIMRRPDGQIVLIDFGAVKQITEAFYNQKNSSKILTLGYAPPEQFDGNAVPQSDFFALGRTFVHLLTRQHPIDLKEIDGRIEWRSHLQSPFPKPLLDLIDDLMHPVIESRPNTTEEIQQRLDHIFHTLLASPDPELSESLVTAETKNIKNKFNYSWQNHKPIVFIGLLISTILWGIFASISQFKNYFKLQLPITFSEINLLLDEITLEQNTGMQAVERGVVVASANFYPKTDTFIVDDEAKDGRRAYVEYKIPETKQRGLCEDTDGATSPAQSCHLSLGKNLNIFWRLCVRDADGPKAMVCTEIRRDKT